MHTIAHAPARLWINGWMDVQIFTDTRSKFYQRSSRIRVDLQSYESKPTDKREKNDWRPWKIWTGRTTKEKEKKTFFYLSSQSVMK